LHNKFRLIDEKKNKKNNDNATDMTSTTKEKKSKKNKKSKKDSKNNNNVSSSSSASNQTTNLENTPTPFDNGSNNHFDETLTEKERRQQREEEEEIEEKQKQSQREIERLMKHQSGQIMKKEQAKSERESLLNNSNNSSNNSPNNNSGKGYIRISQRILGDQPTKPVTSAPLTADGEDKYLKIQEAVIDTKYVMKQNVEKMKDNNQSVDHLKETTNLLRIESEIFHKGAQDLHKAEKSNFKRRRIMMAVGCTVCICVVCAGTIFPIIYFLT